MKTPTHYQILRVPAEASQKEIAQAYRRMARRVHPDLQPPERKKRAEEVIKWLNEAYEVLDDPETRVRYDIAIGLRIGTTPDEKKPQRKSPPKSPTAPFPEEWFARDPLSEIFARMRSASWRRRTAFARLLLEILVAGFLLVGAYLIRFEWSYIFTHPLQEGSFGPQWAFAAIWLFVLMITIFKMIPYRW